MKENLASPLNHHGEAERVYGTPLKNGVMTFFPKIIHLLGEDVRLGSWSNLRILVKFEHQ